MTAAVRSAAGSGPVGLGPAVGLDDGPASAAARRRRPSQRARRRRHRHMQLDERPARPEPGVELVPEGHVRLPELPAQPDLAPGGQGREVDEAALDVAQGDAERVDAGDRGRHLVDDALHPQADPAGVSSSIVRGRPAAGRRGVRGERPVAQPDQLGALVGQRREQRRRPRSGPRWRRRCRRSGSSSGDSSRTCAARGRQRVAVAYHRRRIGRMQRHDGPGSRRRSGARRRRLGRAGRRDRDGPGRRGRARRAGRPAVGPARRRRRSAGRRRRGRHRPVHARRPGATRSSAPSAPSAGWTCCS